MTEISAKSGAAVQGKVSAFTKKAWKRIGCYAQLCQILCSLVLVNQPQCIVLYVCCELQCY